MSYAARARTRLRSPSRNRRIGSMVRSLLVAGVLAVAAFPAAAQSQAFIKKANDVAWASVIKRAPESGPRLRQLSGN